MDKLMTQEEWNETIWNELAKTNRESRRTMFGWFCLEEIKQIVKPCKANSKPLKEELSYWDRELVGML